MLAATLSGDVAHVPSVATSRTSATGALSGSVSMGVMRPGLPNGTSRLTACVAAITLALASRLVHLSGVLDYVRAPTRDRAGAQ
jgi:hypothetical protein